MRGAPPPEPGELQMSSVAQLRQRDPELYVITQPQGYICPYGSWVSPTVSYHLPNYPPPIDRAFSVCSVERCTHFYHHIFSVLRGQQRSSLEPRTTHAAAESAARALGPWAQPQKPTRHTISTRRKRNYLDARLTTTSCSGPVFSVIP